MKKKHGGDGQVARALSLALPPCSPGATNSSSNQLGDPFSVFLSPMKRTKYITCGAWTRRFRAILEICAMARSLPHNCFASSAKVLSGKAEATATLFAALAALAAISALATATSRSSSTCSSRSAVHVSWRLRRTYAARHAAARADSSLCVRRSPRGPITVGASGGESDSVSGSVSRSSSDRREQMWRADVASSRGEQMW